LTSQKHGPAGWVARALVFGKELGRQELEAVYHATKAQLEVVDAAQAAASGLSRLAEKGPTSTNRIDLDAEGLRALAVIDEEDRKQLLDAVSKGRGGDGSREEVDRVRYVPPDESWAAKEDALLAKLRQDDEEKKMRLQTELAGSDDLLVKGGFRVLDKATSAANALSKVVPNASVTGGVRKGMDLVRVGNLGDDTGVAFFYDRRSMPPPAQLVQWLTDQVVPALVEVKHIWSLPVGSKS